MSARLACFNCGDHAFRLVVGKTEDHERLALRACKCGSLTALTVDEEMAVAFAAQRARDRAERAAA